MTATTESVTKLELKKSLWMKKLASNILFKRIMNRSFLKFNKVTQELKSPFGDQ